LTVSKIFAYFSQLKNSFLNFFSDLAKHQGDVRKEIARYGREDGYKKYAESRAMMKQHIMKQKQSGLGSLFGGLGGKRS
jgi:hypothetical protein